MQNTHLDDGFRDFTELMSQLKIPVDTLASLMCRLKSPVGTLEWKVNLVGDVHKEFPCKIVT